MLNWPDVRAERRVLGHTQSGTPEAPVNNLDNKLEIFLFGQRQRTRYDIIREMLSLRSAESPRPRQDLRIDYTLLIAGARAAQRTADGGVHIKALANSKAGILQRIFHGSKISQRANAYRNGGGTHSYDEKHSTRKRDISRGRGKFSRWNRR